MFILFGLDQQKDKASFDKWNSVLHSADKEKASFRIDQALKEHILLDSEYRIVRPDGQKIWINALGQCEYDDKNQPIRMTGICMDITRRKRAEEAIEKERARLQLILDSLPVAVAVADETGSLQIVNKKTHEIWAGNLPPSGSIDQYNNYIGYHPGTDVQLERDDWPISRALKQGMTILHEEIDIQRLNGAKGTVLASAMPMKDEEGRTYGALVAYMDISEMKDTEQNLARSNIDLEQFAFIASHDLQEPLRMVINYLALLDKRYHDKLDPRAQEYIRQAIEGGERMRELIDDLLQYSRIDTKKREFVQVDMNDVVEESLDLLKAAIEQNDAEIVVEALPTILADESQMIQVMQNLVGNAVKFRGSERPNIHISACLGAREWTFAIKDNGIGLNVEYADRIFLMFQRLQTRDKYPGSGVGLAIVKKIIEYHGGRVWVESEEGNGSTFCFTVPNSPRSNGKRNGGG
jgi:signal transduction histidine kinase